MKDFKQFIIEESVGFNPQMLKSTHQMLIRIADKFNGDNNTRHKELFKLLTNYFSKYIANIQIFNEDITRGEYLVLMFYSMIATNRVCFNKMKEKLQEYYKTENRFNDIPKITQCMEYANLTDPSILDDVYNIITEDDLIDYLKIIKKNSLKAFQDESAVGKWLTINKGLNIEKPSVGEDFRSIDLKDTKKNYAFQVKSTQYSVTNNIIKFSKYCRIYKKTRTGSTLSKFDAYFYCIVNGNDFIIINNNNIINSTPDSVTVSKYENGNPKILSGTGLNECRDQSYMHHSDYAKMEHLLF